MQTLFQGPKVIISFCMKYNNLHWVASNTRWIYTVCCFHCNLRKYKTIYIFSGTNAVSGKNVNVKTFTKVQDQRAKGWGLLHFLADPSSESRSHCWRLHSLKIDLWAPPLPLPLGVECMHLGALAGPLKQRNHTCTPESKLCYSIEGLVLAAGCIKITTIKMRTKVMKMKLSAMWILIVNSCSPKLRASRLFERFGRQNKMTARRWSTGHQSRTATLVCTSSRGQVQWVPAWQIPDSLKNPNKLCVLLSENL